MQVSKSKLNKDTKSKLFSTFYQTIADINKPIEAKKFFSNFLTKTEQISLAKRLMIAYLLEKGKSYDYIRRKIKVSSATIASVDKMMSSGSEGFAMALRKIDADEWATKTAKKVSQLVNNFIGK